MICVYELYLPWCESHESLNQRVYYSPSPRFRRSLPTQITTLSGLHRFFTLIRSQELWEKFKKSHLFIIVEQLFINEDLEDRSVWKQWAAFLERQTKTRFFWAATLSVVDRSITYFKDNFLVVFSGTNICGEGRQKCFFELFIAFYFW